MREMATGSGSSRFVLLALAIAAIVVAAALFGLSDPESASEANRLEESAASTETDPRASLEGSAESASTRADAPEPEAEKANSPVATRALVISGTVLDARTRAVAAGVEIKGFAQLQPGEGHARGETVTDSQGRYLLEIHWDGEPRGVKLTATGERIKRVERLIEPARFQPDPGTVRPLVASEDFEVQSVLALRGRLVRESDGRPLGGGSANLVLVEKPPALPRSVPTCGWDWDDFGFIIQVEAMIPGELAVVGNSPGFLARMKPASFDPTRTVDIGDIALREGACIEGVVSTADGSETLATHVMARAKAADQAWMHLEDGSWAVRGDVLVPWGAQTTLSRHDGTFRLCGLAPERYDLFVDYSGCRTPSRLDSLEVQAPASDIRLQLTTAVYRLAVFDAQSGAKLEDAHFWFDQPSDFACGIRDDSVIATDPSTESSGRIVAEGYRVLECNLPALAASEVRSLEFRLEPLPSLVAVTMVVTSPEGTPVEDIEVEIRSDSGEVDGQGPMPRMDHNAPDGRHELPPLVPGTYHVEIDPQRHGDPVAEMWLGVVLELHVRGGSNPVEVRLVEGGLVQATVTKKDGTPVDARTSLVRSPEIEPELIDWRNDAGTFGGWIPKQTPVRLAKPLPAGPWTLRFEAEGCVAQDVVVNIAAGQTTPIAVALEPEPPR